ncbi:hypothetical protein [Rothia nasimurium]|uniref:hypothetical protein n=1 Tax=Rothia nasimurium TaxID=85336 RepID=UPI001F27377A|nr:hypothetical protein [Rothia nasimurium]
MTPYYSKTTLASAFLIGSMAFAGCGAAQEASDSTSSSVESVGAAINLTEEQKRQLEPAIKNYFMKAREAGSLHNMPDDIQAIIDKAEGGEDAENLKDLGKAIDTLSADDRQKLLEYSRGIDPTYDLFERSGLTEGEDVALSLMNTFVGSMFSGLDTAIIESITVDLNKVEFGERTATTSTDSFLTETETSTSTSVPESVTAAAEGALVALFDGTSFTYEEGAWKIDADSFLDTFNRSIDDANK